MEATLYTVKTPVFEGPLDLLLDLINKRKLFVSDVSLAEVTDDFLAYIDSHEEFPMGESAEFILIASTLMLIKSRSLLPGLMLTMEEEEDIHDLEHRLSVHAFFKELSGEIRKIYGKELIFEKLPSKTQPIVFSPDSKTNVENIYLALSQVLESLPKENSLPKAVVKKMISLEEMIESLAVRINEGMKMSFNSHFGLSAGEAGARGQLTREKKVSVIVGFLAMLELVKRGIIRVTQSAEGEIEMQKNDQFTISNLQSNPNDSISNENCKIEN